MKTIGYVYKTIEEKESVKVAEKLSSYGCDSVVVEEYTSAKETHQELNKAIEDMEPGDRLVIDNIICLGKSVIQLADFLVELEEKEIQLVVLDKGFNEKEISNETYITMIKKMAEMEKQIIRERTSRGLEEARRQGRIGGRPKISQETVERIQFLYHNNKYTLRQIAEECNISLGTAYKYTQEQP